LEFLHPNYLRRLAPKRLLRESSSAKHTHVSDDHYAHSRTIDIAPWHDVDMDLYNQLPVWVPRVSSRQQARRKVPTVEAQALMVGNDARCFALPGDKLTSIIMGTVSHTPNALDLPIGTKVDLADFNAAMGQGSLVSSFTKSNRNDENTK
jgi:hypothetical protein